MCDCGCGKSAASWQNPVGSEQFIPGDIGFPVVGSSSFNFDQNAAINLKSRSLLLFVVGSNIVSLKPQGGNVLYATFTQVSGNITLTNGTFQSGVLYTLLYL